MKIYFDKENLVDFITKILNYYNKSAIMELQIHLVFEA